MEKIINDEGLSVQIQQDVILKTVAAAILKTEGVSRLPDKKSIKLEKSKEENFYTSEVHIVVNYGVNIPSVAWNVQRTVKNDVMDMLGINMKSIDIHVDGIDFPEGEILDEQN